MPLPTPPLTLTDRYIVYILLLHLVWIMLAARSKKNNLGRCQTDFIWPIAKAESVFIFDIYVHFINMHYIYEIYMYTYTKYVSNIYLIVSYI